MYMKTNQLKRINKEIEDTFLFQNFGTSSNKAKTNVRKSEQKRRENGKS